MLAEFADWWLRQMRGLLPAGVTSPTVRPDARIIAIDRLGDQAGQAPGGTILLRRNGKETPLSVLDIDHPQALAGTSRAMPTGMPTGLRLPPATLMRREVALPLAAARAIEAAIGFEMDRMTPFTADELFWDLGEARQDRLHGRVHVPLFFVLREQVNPLLQTLRRAGLTPGFIEGPAGDAGDARIDLAAEHRAPAGWRRSLVIACAILGMLCLLSPFLRQQIALNAVAARIGAIAAPARIAENLRRQLEIAAGSQAAIAEARRQGEALQVLASLTDALPDGTFLDDLMLKSGDLSFDGRSADAAALIGRLSAVPSLKNPSFTAPITRTADGGADQFSMHATVQE